MNLSEIIPSKLDNLPFIVNSKPIKAKAIIEAFKEADKGEFISSEAMHKWVNSWGNDDELPAPEIDIICNPS
jgi:predicted transcriptional regulator